VKNDKTVVNLPVPTREERKKGRKKEERVR
jgi:hypothetical protein